MDDKEINELRHQVRMETLTEVRERMRGINFGHAFTTLTPIQFVSRIMEETTEGKNIIRSSVTQTVE